MCISVRNKDIQFNSIQLRHTTLMHGMQIKRVCVRGCGGCPEQNGSVGCIPIVVIPYASVVWGMIRE